MDKLLIEGGARLSGEIRASGAKNATLPILCAALLTDEPLTVSNVPQLEDVATCNRLLRQMGAEVTIGEKMGREIHALQLTTRVKPASSS